MLSTWLMPDVSLRCSSRKLFREVRHEGMCLMPLQLSSLSSSRRDSADRPSGISERPVREKMDVNKLGFLSHINSLLCPKR